VQRVLQAVPRLLRVPLVEDRHYRHLLLEAEIRPQGICVVQLDPTIVVLILGYAIPTCLKWVGNLVTLREGLASTSLIIEAALSGLTGLIQSECGRFLLHHYAALILAVHGSGWLKVLSDGNVRL
jgi:hypothetical protein